MSKKITVICITTIAIAEIVVTGTMKHSYGLFIIYGLYKLLTE
jgi:hypothetical protein